MTKISERIQRGQQQHGSKWDASELEAAHPSIRDAFESGLRVRVRTTYANGETFERTGTVSTTMGWRPAYILMHRSNAHGSWDVLGPRDEVVATWRGRKYEAGTPYGRRYASPVVQISERLEYLRGELRAERISYGELAELQSLAPHIDRDDVELLEAAGVPEHSA